MKHPRISVIMGIYNDDKFLEKAINSILKQTYRDYEFIICDDGSVDNSKAIAKEYAKKDKRIVYLENQKNEGLASTLNNCLKIAKGEFIARMDSDDISMSNRFEEQVAYMDAHEDIAVVGSGIEYIDNNDAIYKNLILNESITLRKAAQGFCIVHPSVLIRKNVLIEVDGYTVNKNTYRAEDYDLWCKILEKGYGMSNMQNILLQYREDLSGFNKRKYEYRLQEYRIKKYWIKKIESPKLDLLFAYKPLFVGLIPKRLMKNIKKRG